MKRDYYLSFLNCYFMKRDYYIWFNITLRVYLIITSFIHVIHYFLFVNIFSFIHVIHCFVFVNMFLHYFFVVFKFQFYEETLIYFVQYHFKSISHITKEKIINIKEYCWLEKSIYVLIC
jgi:hypothetical protein